MHPELAELLAYVDGALARRPHKRVDRHIERCGECLQEVRRLRVALLPGPEPEAAPPTGLLARVRDWETRRQRQDANPAKVHERVAAEIAPYLGERTSARIVEDGSKAGAGVLARVEPVLELFLGSRAANSLVNAVVDRAIMGL